MSNLDPIVESIRTNFADKYRAREQALQLSRDVIRHSANAIRAVHRGEIDRGRDLLGQARRLLDEILEALRPHPDICYAGFVQDAEKEYAEASAVVAITAGERVPGPDQLRVGYAPYLNGLAETVGELRRQVLDIIRRGETARSEELLAFMDDIYASLVTIDFPDGMTGGLRRSTDVARGILEKTRGDLTLALRQRDLEETLRHFEQRLTT